MKNFSRLLFLALAALAALRAQSGPATTESSARAAVAAKASTPQSPPAPIERPAAPVPTSATFGPVVERDLSFDPIFTNEGIKVNYLELKSGNFVNQAPPGDIGALLGENDMRVRHGINLAVVSVAPNRWDSTPGEVLGELTRAIPQKDVRLGGSDKVQTYFFQTHEGTAGTLQVEQTSQPGVVRIRYKLLRVASVAPSGAKF